VVWLIIKARETGQPSFERAILDALRHLMSPSAPDLPV